MCMKKSREKKIKGSIIERGWMRSPVGVVIQQMGRPMYAQQITKDFRHMCT